MRYEKNRKVAGFDEFKLMKLMKFLALPILVAVLIIVIFIADLPNRKKDKPAETAAETVASETAAAAESIPETTAPYDYANAAPERNSNEEIAVLVDKYLTARIKGDADTLYSMFGREDQLGLEALRLRMENEKKLYDAFENTVIYTVPGLEEDSYILYIQSQIWFRKAGTPAPVLMRTYAYRAADGSYRLKEDSRLSNEEYEIVSEADASPAVRQMNSEIRKQLAKAVVSDARLGSIYEQLKEGGTLPETVDPEAVTEAQDESEAVISIDAESAEEEESAAAETEAESQAAEETH